LLAWPPTENHYLASFDVMDSRLLPHLPGGRRYPSSCTEHIRPIKLQQKLQKMHRSGDPELTAEPNDPQTSPAQDTEHGF
jgi:hypothetical protein